MRWRLRVRAVATTTAVVCAAGATTVTGTLTDTATPLSAVSARAASALTSPVTPASPVLVQKLTVNWSGGMRGARTRATAVVPGIGQATIICRRNDTRIQLRPHDPTAETQMWTAKYETKRGEPTVAVKTARVYRYAHAGDTSGGGTGRTTHEGLNQQTPVEAASTGYLHGVISSRPGRHLPAATATTAPATSFSLSWNWSRMTDSKRGSCQVRARFVTNVAGHRTEARKVARKARKARKKADPQHRNVLNKAKVRKPRSTSVGLNWHGDPDAARVGQTHATGRLGTLVLRCEPGRDGAAELSVRPVGKNTWLWAEQITGEGLVLDHVETTSLGVDPTTGLLGPIDLPGNGMLRIYLSRGKKEEAYVLSSVRLTNDADHRDLNFCEIALAPWRD